MVVMARIEADRSELVGRMLPIATRTRGSARGRVGGSAGRKDLAKRMVGSQKLDTEKGRKESRDLFKPVSPRSSSPYLFF
jgi:hypothetical protein